MIKNKIKYKTKLNLYNVQEGETIETKIERILTNKEPIEDTAPIIYTDRKDGVRPEFNIRTDRWEYAQDATDAITKTAITKRNEFLKIKDEKNTPEGGKETPSQSETTGS